MNGSGLRALRVRLAITAEVLAAEIGTSPAAIQQIETRKSVSVAAASRYVIAAFEVAGRDLSKREALARELTETGQDLQQEAAAMRVATTRYETAQLLENLSVAPLPAVRE